MSKIFKSYAICWVILLAAFNVIRFVIPSCNAFWAAYIFITLAFVGQLACAYYAFKAENRKKLFYNLPLITISFSGLICTVVFGVLCMVIPGFPVWVSILVCLLVLVFCAIAVIMANANADIVSDIDNKINSQTQFIKTLTVEAQGLVNHAKSEPVRFECAKVYESARYSDPMSTDALADTEAQITAKMSELAAAVKADDFKAVKKNTKKIIYLLNARNANCKAIKLK